ncbi:MAG: sigma-70 family RNA polymerase sigma factor [Patescibacteria group bacterium]|nr:sigma-70 family RNA polymerase sigma factor [Patescibacteria group bacterium]
MEKPDEELVVEHLAGNEEAFTLLVKRHLKGIYSFVARLAAEEADDIVQDTFLKAWKGLRSYDSRSAAFKTWLTRIARNAAIDHLRKKKPLVFSDFGDGTEDGFPDPEDSEPLPDEAFARAEDAQALEEALKSLQPLYREVILLRDMSQLTFEEMGAVLGAPVNTVRSRYRRGLARMKRLLESVHQKGM